MDLVEMVCVVAQNSVEEHASWYAGIVGAVALVGSLAHWVTKLHYDNLLDRVEKGKSSSERELATAKYALDNLTLQVDLMRKNRVETADALRALHRLLSASAEILNTGTASVLIRHPQESSLVFLAAIGPARNRILSLKVPLDGSQAGQAYTSKMPRLMDAGSTGGFHAAADQRSGYSTRSLLSVPLLREDGERIGVVQYGSSRSGHFGVDDVDKVKALLQEISDITQKVILDEKLLKILPVGQIRESVRSIVLFADVTSFGGLFATSRPCDVVSFLNDVASSAWDIIKKNGGEIGGYPGDGFFACFRTGGEASQLEQALTAARELQWVFSTVCEAWGKLGMTVSDLELRIGIAGGECCACQLGHPSDAVSTFIGPGVNEAFDVCEFARIPENRIAVSGGLQPVLTGIGNRIGILSVQRNPGDFLSFEFP